MKRKIYKSAFHAPGEGEYYVIPLYRDHTTRYDWVTLTIKVNEQESDVFYGYLANQSLLDDPNFYVEAGEIDLDEVLTPAVLEAAKRRAGNAAD